MRRWLSSVNEEFSASVWDQCKLSIMRSLGPYEFLVLTPVEKTYDDWRAHVFPRTGWIMFLPLYADKGA
jgi:hypothetical protein